MKSSKTRLKPLAHCPPASELDNIDGKMQKLCNGAITSTGTFEVEVLEPDIYEEWSVKEGMVIDFCDPKRVVVD